MNINLPDDVKFIIDTLESGGFEAYAVGGCVRDSLLGKSPQDWDICTPALPEQTMKCFNGQHIIETGLQHGTITLMLNHKPFEITTYRVDGKYKDNRRPEKVRFVNVLKRDLARRDFTINAMAYNPQTGLADYYGGQQDLSERKIKCVGNADKRFQEDALRIMRALRFASVFGFTIDDDTAKAMHENKKLLNNISAERIAAELNKLIVGDSAKQTLLGHTDILTEIIPEFIPAVGFNQKRPEHCYNVFEHSLHSLSEAPKDIIIRLAVLFHDIGKPATYTDENGLGRYFNHFKVGAEITEIILKRLRYDNDTIKAVTELVRLHDSGILLEAKYIKRWLNKIGEERFRQLLEVKKADIKGLAGHIIPRALSNINKVEQILAEVTTEQQCFSLKDLVVNGRDLIAAGVPEGAKIGVILNKLMDMVIDDESANDKAALLEIAELYAKEL